MKIRLGFIIGFLIAFSGIFYSCEDEGDNGKEGNEKNDGTEQSVVYLETEAEIDYALKMAYNTLYFDGMYLRMYPCNMDIRADDVQNTSPWIFSQIEDYEKLEDDYGYAITWKSLFWGIEWVNKILVSIDDVEMDKESKESKEGEAVFLRGIFYYFLANTYKEVPLLEEPYDTLPFPPSNTREEIWEFVLSDLLQAIEILPTKDAWTGNDLGRATKGAAAGFAAKVYMIKKQFVEASEMLTGIIEGNYGNYALMQNYADNFTSDSEFNTESVFEISFGKDIGGDARSWLPYDSLEYLDKTSAKAKTYAPTPYGWGDMAPTQWIYNEFKLEQTTDGNDDPRMKASLWYAGNDENIYGDVSKTIEDLSFAVPIEQKEKVFIKKYLNLNNPDAEIEWRSEINERVMRYSEVLLLLAEAYIEMGILDEAMQYIQMVRDRAGLPPLTVGSTYEEMMDIIAHERALEFCFESIRFIDLLRWGWFDDAVKLDELQSHDAHFENYIPGREYFPIPTEILENNPEITQSPGW